MRRVRWRAVPARGRPRGDRAEPARGLCAADGAPARLLQPARPAHDGGRRGIDRGDPQRDPCGGRGGAMIILKSEREIALMREAGHILADAMERLRASVRPGVSTLEVDEEVEAFIPDAAPSPPSRVIA